MEKKMEKQRLGRWEMLGWEPCYNLNSVIFEQSLEGGKGLVVWKRDCPMHRE